MTKMIGVEHREHVRVTRENAADGCVSVVTELVRYDWQCPRCGWRCDKWEDFCSFCKWDRNDDGVACSCGHLNFAAADECKACGT